MYCFFIESVYHRHKDSINIFTEDVTKDLKQDIAKLKKPTIQNYLDIYQKYSESSDTAYIAFVKDLLEIEKNPQIKNDLIIQSTSDTTRLEYLAKLTPNFNNYLLIENILYALYYLITKVYEHKNCNTYIKTFFRIYNKADKEKLSECIHIAYGELYLSQYTTELRMFKNYFPRIEELYNFYSKYKKTSSEYFLQVSYHHTIYNISKYLIEYFNFSKLTKKPASALYTKLLKFINDKLTYKNRQYSIFMFYIHNWFATVFNLESAINYRKEYFINSENNPEDCIKALTHYNYMLLDRFSLAYEQYKHGDFKI